MPNAYSPAALARSLFLAAVMPNAYSPAQLDFLRKFAAAPVDRYSDADVRRMADFLLKQAAWTIGTTFQAAFPISAREHSTRPSIRAGCGIRAKTRQAICPATAVWSAAPAGAMPPPPADPSSQAMGDQEMMRSIIRDEIQKAMGGGEGGVANGTKKGSGNKFEDALRVLEDKMKEQSKIFVAALRNAGIEIPLADLYGIDKADGSGAAAGTPTAAQSQPGLSETLQTGLGGDAAGSQPGKIASLGHEEEQIAQLTKLARTKDSLQRSALAGRMIPFDPNEADLSYLAGLFR